MLTSPPDLTDFFANTSRTDLALQLGFIAALVATAWGIVWRLARRQAPGRSIWLGERVVDGVLFPTLALLLVLAGRQGLVAAGMTPLVFKLAIPVLLSLALIRLSAQVLDAAFPESPRVVLVERTVSWLAWGAVVMWITGILPLVLDELDQIQWRLGSRPVSLRTLLEGGLSASFVLVIALWVSAALETRLLGGATGAQLSLRKAAANALRALLLFVGLLLALSAVGIDLTALSVLGGALGVGIGFGLQKLAANYISGFVILAERSLRIGDLVRVGDFEGRITDISTRYTLIRAFNGREAIVPNETLITSTVQNLSLADRRLLLTSTLCVAYGTDVSALREALRAAIGQVERVLAEPAPQVMHSAFVANGLELTAQFWIDDPERGSAAVVSEVNRVMLAVLEARQTELGLGSGATRRFVPPPA
jgi:small-conductance mechanosensitive channel